MNDCDGRRVWSYNVWFLVFNLRVFVSHCISMTILLSQVPASYCTTIPESWKPHSHHADCFTDDFSAFHSDYALFDPDKYLLTL